MPMVTSIKHFLNVSFNRCETHGTFITKYLQQTKLQPYETKKQFYPKNYATTPCDILRYYHNINNNLNHTKNNSPFIEALRKRDDSTL